MTFRLAFIMVLVAAVVSFTSLRPETQPKFNPNTKLVRTIIIDPGHGGKDYGAGGSFSHEKDICLAVSLKLGKLIQEKYPDIKLLFTRTTDTYPTLYDRANFANNNNGDLFICVHVNSAPDQIKKEFIGNKTVVTYEGKGKKRKKVTRQVPQYKTYRVASTAKGTETYIWGANISEQKEVAVRENAPMLAEDNYQTTYGTMDPSSPEFVALALLKTKQYFKRSATFAGFIQDEFVKVGRVDRDVRQRPVPIWVLQATAMPSVLIETGFISNQEEERYLNSEIGQNELSECILRALGNYFTWLEQRQTEEPPPTQSKARYIPAPIKTERFLEYVEARERERWGK
ncbi:MAG: N-acetylmuramoyl-L-alanine amidase [Bacteroidetes bacterium]|nr:N-acetylmuramoyl-L-alanine amidase [Bacteroidota bacterium]